MTPPLVCEGSPSAGVPWFVIPPLVFKGSLTSGVLAGDSSSGLWGELASASTVGVSAWSWYDSVDDSFHLSQEGGLRCY